MNGCKNVYREIAQGHLRWARRSVYFTVIQEAEYRGIELPWWNDVTIENARRQLLGDCIDRSHNMVGDKCINCHKQVTREQVLEHLPNLVKVL